MFQSIQAKLATWTERQQFSCLWFTIELVGLLFILFTLASLIGQFWRLFKLYFLRQINCPLFGQAKDLTKRYGQWAVITGGSSGIGLAHARQLARRGMSIIIISN